MSLNPFNTLLKTIYYFITRKIQFPKDHINEIIMMEDRQQFQIFRHVVMSTNHNGENPTIFKVKFHLANMSPERNIRFSLIPMLFILGLPGFRAKFWTFNEINGDFQGIYEWDNFEDAENYTNSFALRFMTSRSVPGSVSYKIIPDKSLNDYVGSLNASALWKTYGKKHKSVI